MMALALLLSFVPFLGGLPGAPGLELPSETLNKSNITSCPMHSETPLAQPSTGPGLSLPGLSLTGVRDRIGDFSDVQTSG